jgi:hypothetical protein
MVYTQGVAPLGRRYLPSPFSPLCLLRIAIPPHGVLQASTAVPAIIPHLLQGTGNAQAAVVGFTVAVVSEAM